jgi:hypothetical protein
MRTRKQYRAVLDRALGYAVQSSGVGPFRRAGGTAQRSWNLARAIQARYAAIERRWPMMAFVFERPECAGVSVSYVYNVTHPSIFTNHRVMLRMLIGHRERQGHAVAERTPAQPFGRMPPIAFAALPGRKREPQENEKVIARIVQRAVRDENPSRVNIRPMERTALPATQAAQNRSVPSARSASLARVFRRSTGAKSDDPPVAATARTERERPSTAVGRDTNTAHGAHSPVDITRITDQVIHALDRRLVAQRERMGRA